MASDVEQRDKVWNECLKIISDNISTEEFVTWFKPLKLVELDGQKVVLFVPSPTYKDHIERTYIELLGMTLRRVIGPNIDLTYRVPYISTEETDYTVVERSNPNVAYVNPNVFDPFRPVRRKVPSRIDPNKNFDNYIEGEFNKTARAVGLSVAANPGMSCFNPLYIYSQSGLGKTHLAHAIGCRCLGLHPDKNVLYVSANEFENQYRQAAIQNNTLDFLNFYQMIDVLIIDDIQEMANGKKDGTQNMLFNIFNHLYQSNKQVIFTSDKAPKDIQNFEERILSRFKCGVSLKIDLPDVQTKFTILKQMRDTQGLQIDDAILQYIAEAPTNNIRELEGILGGLLAHSITMNRSSIDMATAQKVVSQTVSSKAKSISIADIQELVCSYFHMQVSEIQTKSRKRDIVQARQISMYLARKYTKNSLTTIGEEIGGRDHATVLHACKTVSDLCETDKDIRQSVADLENSLR